MMACFKAFLFIRLTVSVCIYFLIHYTRDMGHVCTYFVSLLALVTYPGLKATLRKCLCKYDGMIGITYLIARAQQR